LQGFLFITIPKKYKEISRLLKSSGVYLGG
jgi:hypothetical protein